MKLLKAVKHTGEREAGIDLQMRLIPLKTETEDEIPTVEIEIRKDPKRKSGGENSLKVEVPRVDSLNGTGVQFASNMITIQKRIFNQRGWTDHKSLSNRLNTIQRFLHSLAINSFVDAMEAARMIFIKELDPELDDELCQEALKNEEVFEGWVTSEVQGLGYLNAQHNTNQKRIEDAEKKVLRDYERAIMWIIGKQLWHHHGQAFEKHFRYFMYQIVKPYDMSVEVFDHEMKLFAERLKMIQPPSKKGAVDFTDADWEKQAKLVDNDAIRQAIFYSLPVAYQNDIENNHSQDWRHMDDATFIQAMVNFEGKDKADQKIKKAQREQDKQDKKRKRENSHDNSNQRGRRNYRNNNNKDREKKFCKWCKDAGRRYYENHNTDDCTIKDKKFNERNDMEKEMKELFFMKKEMNSLTKIMKKNIKRMKSYDSDSDDSH